MPLLGVNNPPSAREWEDAFELIISTRGLQADMDDSIDIIKASGSRAMLHELVHDAKKLGLKTYANIVRLCHTDDEVREVVSSARHGGKQAANLKMIALTGYDMEGRFAIAV